MKLTKPIVEQIINYVKDNQNYFNHNGVVFDILEGDLLSHLTRKITEEANTPSALGAQDRVAPINVLTKINNKVTQLYNDTPIRRTENPVNQELLDEYSVEKVDEVFGDANFNFNAYKNTSIEIFENPEVQGLDYRSLPSTSFIPFSNSEINPMKPTAQIKIMGEHMNKDGGVTTKIWIYTDEDFLSVTLEGDVVREDMKTVEKGINPFNVIPLAYVSKSRNLLVPMPDTDLVTMTLRIPELFTDVNFSSKYQSQPIVYGINIDMDNLDRNPNVIWNFKSTDIDNKPELNVLDTSPNIPDQLQNIAVQLSTWLETRDIRAGSIGSPDGDDFASGLSLMIANMDTTNNIKKQRKFMRSLENDFWRRLGVMHNRLVETGRLPNRKRWVEPETMIVRVEYSDIKPYESKYDKGVRLVNEVNNRLTPRVDAIQEQHGVDEVKAQEMMKEANEIEEILIGTTKGDDNNTEQV